MIKCKDCKYKGNGVTNWCKGHYEATDFELALKHSYADGCDFGVERKRVHIIKRGEKWAMLKEEKSRASRIYDDKKVAIESASKLLERGYDLIIHNVDGTVQKWEHTSRKQTYRVVRTPHSVSVTREPLKKLIDRAGSSE